MDTKVTVIAMLVLVASGAAAGASPVRRLKGADFLRSESTFLAETNHARGSDAGSDGIQHQGPVNENDPAAPRYDPGSVRPKGPGAAPTPTPGGKAAQKRG